MPPDAGPPRSVQRGAAALVVVAALAAACASDPPPAPTAEDYRRELEAICADVDARLEVLPQPPDDITLADYATRVADALLDEAERARLLEPPDELEDDHRAFIRNTDDQVSSWRELATVSPDDAESLERLSTLIGELTLGRNDLSAEMGTPRCGGAG